MKAHWGTMIIAAAMIAAGLGGAPAAQARTAIDVAVVIPGGVAFDISTGGYCDRWGCPVAYWGYPVWYGPTYCGGVWYQGPVYYQTWNGAPYYWVHGGWCPNEWVGPHPVWWSSSFYFGPVLSFTWYESHSFRISSSARAYWQSHGGNRANWSTIAHQQFTTAAAQGRIARARPARATSTQGVAPSGRAAKTRTSKGSASTKASQRTSKGSASTKASQRTTGAHRSGGSPELTGPRRLEERAPGPGRPSGRDRKTRGPSADREGGPDRGGHRGGPHG